MIALMAKPKKKPAEPNPWPRRLKALRERLNRTDTAMAAMLRISHRVWVSWIYGERRPSATAQYLIELAEQGKLPD